MGRISALTALLFISGIWLPNHCAHGQTTNASDSQDMWASETTVEAAVVLGNSNDCPSYVQSGLDFCVNSVGANDLLGNLEDPNFDVCSISFQQYSCAPLENIIASTAFSILNCPIKNKDAIITQGAVSLFFSKLKMDTIKSVLNILNSKVSSASLSDQLKFYLLNGVWERVVQDPENLTPGALAVWIQEYLYAFIPAISPDNLNCITAKTVTCDGLEAMVKGLSLQYSSFSNESRSEIGMWITRFIKSRSCHKDSLADSLNSYYGSFKADMSVADFNVAFPNNDLENNLGILTEYQVQQYVETTNAFESYESASTVLNLLSTKNFDYNYAFLNSLPSSNYNNDVLYSMLLNVLGKLNTIEDPLCKPKLKTIFQGKLSYLLTAANETILQMLAPQDCSDFQDIYQGFDAVYNSLSSETKQLVYQYRSKFLQEELEKSGSGCTYGVNSVEWLDKNYGKSIEYASYAELILYNKNFDGYQVAYLLNIDQIIDMLLETELLTSPSPIDIQIRVSLITNATKEMGSSNIKMFQTEMKKKLLQMGNKIIVNIQVRFLIFEMFWKLMKPEFPEYNSNDWQNMTESMSPFISAIRSEQLNDLSHDVVKDCSNMKTIVGGLGPVFSYMDDNSKSEATDWISNFLRNETSRCKSEEGDWLADNYMEFKSYVSIATIKELNSDYSLVNNINLFTPKQLGELVVLEPEAHTNVELVENVFEVLTNGTHEQNVVNLGNFWDMFIVEYEKAENFTNEVKHVMLYSTVSELSSSFETFTASDTTLWFETRMYPVMPVIDSEVLKEISLDVGCEFQTSFVNAVSFVSDETDDQNKQDVLDYIQKYLENDKTNKPGDKSCTKQVSSTVTYIVSYFGAYSEDTSYSELTTYYTDFDVFESGVFKILTRDQFGDMMVQENIYESELKVTQVFEYLSTQTVDNVDVVMTRFSETGYKNNIQITNVTIGQKILQNYFNIINTKVTTYTTAQIKQLFEMKIYILIQFFSTQTLSLFVVRDCDTLVIIVVELNKGFGKMSETTKKDIASWIIATLKSSSINGCTSSYTTTPEWVDHTLKGFFQYTSLKEVQTVYPQLDVLSIIEQTSISQKVEYLCTSTALTDVTVTSTVLESLKGQDNVTSAQEVVTFLDTFNTAYEQLNIKTMTIEVREEAMSYLFSSYVSDFNSLTTQQISSFQETFSYFFAGITSNLVQEIPVTISCDSYKSIFGGISSAYDEFSDDVKGAVFNRIINYLDNHDTSSSDVCSSLYTDTKSYIQVMFQKFSYEATIYEFESYYSKFDAYSCLDVFSGTQLGNLLMNTTAIKSQMEAVQILVELKKRDYSDVVSFMTEMVQVAEEKNITNLTDSNVQDVIFENVWPRVIANIKTEDDYKEWFGGKLDLVIASCSVEQITSIPVDITCESQKVLLGGFNKAYEELGDEEKTAMFKRIKAFNKEVKGSQGHACETKSGSSGEWIQDYYGEFKEMATLADFKEDNSNFSASTALDVLTGSQKAEYVIESGALKNEDAIAPVLESIDSPTKAKDFLDKCNSDAPDELQSSPVGKMILEKTFEVLTPVINSFQSTDWQEWTQITLRKILQNINETELEIINYPLTCTSYQQLIIGLNNVFDIMKEDSRQAVYNKCIKPQFNTLVSTTGIKCGQTKQNSDIWVQNNFAKFASLVDIKEFMDWNTEFNVVNVISSLSPSQLADVAVSSVTNEEVACQIAANVQEFDVSGVNSFLDELSSTLKEKNIKSMTSVVGSKYLSSSLSVISGSLSSFSSSQWDDLVSVKLQPLMFSLNSQQLTTMLDSADCNAYKAILNQLNNNYDSFDADTRQNMYEALYTHISNSNAPSGFCPQIDDDSGDRMLSLFGKFSIYLSYSQIINMDLQFNLTLSVDILSPSQLADVSLNENVFADQDKANTLNGRLAQLSFADTDSFLRSFYATAQEKKLGAIPSGSIQQSIFSTIFSKVSTQFASFTVSQWNDYFGSLFSWFLPSLQVSQVEMIPETISCEAFQSVISGCSNYYEQLPADVQSAVYKKIMSFLTKSQPASGPSCPSLGGSGNWLVTNFGEFRAQASISDLYYLNANFIATDAISYLTPIQLGTYVANNEVLSDKVKVDNVMSVLNSQNIGSFLDAFNAECAKKGITAINNAVVKKSFMGEIFCKAGSGFASYTSENYADFFQNKLKLMISGLDARSLGFIPTDIGCDSLAAIMNPLSDVGNPENPTDVFNFAESVLLKQQKNTGDACTNGLNSREWGLKFFNQYMKAGSWDSILTLNPKFDLTDTTDLLSSAQLAEATAGTTIIHNVTVITTVMATIGGDIKSLSTFMDTLMTYVALDPSLLTNSKVKEVLLSAVAHTVLSELNTLSVDDINSWMNKISFLLPSFNETILEFIPVDIDCLHFQAFVSNMNNVFSQLTQLRQQAVANFIKEVLSYKHEHGDEPCTTSGQSTAAWALINIGSYCSLLTADEMAIIKPDLNKVSYETFCSLS